MKNSREISFRIPTKKRAFKEVYRLRITLAGIEPEIWRRVEVPSTYTFYDLHVAIQDAMGWEDRHLHLFEVAASRKPIRIECPFAEPEFGENIQYWTTEVALKSHLKRVGTVMKYRYDFGDDWLHIIRLEGIMARESGVEYPRCVDGARACPPEDCGGPYGHKRCIEALEKADPEDEFLDWVGDWRPEVFNASRVQFADPRLRFLQSFEE